MANALNNIAKTFDKAIVEPLRKRMVGRKLVPVNGDLSGAGLGMQSVDYWTMAEMSAAEINYDLMENNEDTLDSTEATVRVPIIQKSYKIPYRALQSYTSKGIKVDSSLAVEAAYLVAYEEDKLIIDGWKPDGTNYVVNGLYQSATNTEGSALGFDTYGNAIKKISAATALLEADNVYGPFNLVLNPVQKNELMASESTTGRSEWDRVIGMLNEQGGNVGTVYSTPILAAGTGMLLPVSDIVYYDLIVAKDPFNVLGTDSKQGSVSPVYGSVIDAMTIRTKHTNAICTLTSI